MSKPITVPVSPHMPRPSCAKCGCTSVAVTFNPEVNALILSCDDCGARGACECSDAPRVKGGKSTRSIELPEVEADDDQGNDDRDDDGEGA